MRKFKAYVIKQENEVGLGLEEYSEDVTFSIASIYVKPKPSNKDLFDIIAQTVIKKLESDETALLRITAPLVAKYQWRRQYDGRIFVKRELTAHMPFIQTKLLAEDALTRKTIINEKLDEGLRFYYMD